MARVNSLISIQGTANFCNIASENDADSPFPQMFHMVFHIDGELQDPSSGLCTDNVGDMILVGEILYSSSMIEKVF